MDQESFRKLLQTPRAGASSTPVARGSLLGQGKRPVVATKPSKEPAFRPRAIKQDKGKDKKDEKFRDRAAERREGKEGDFADVEAVLEEFEKQNEGEEDMESKRAYLGGDASHSVLVRGLDRALLAQNRARLASSTNAEADEDLEDTFASLASATTDPAPVNSQGKKRSRADILAALKAQREGMASEDQAKTEEKGALPAAGKFKPIAGNGFKPVGDKKKKKRAKEEAAAASGEDSRKRKKKRKVDAGAVDAKQGAEAVVESSEVGDTVNDGDTPALSAAPSEPQLPANDEFDIFVDAGEYGGLAASDSDSDADEEKRAPSPPQPLLGAPKRGWFDDPEPSPLSTALSLPILDKGKAKAPTSANGEQEEDEMQFDQPEVNDEPLRLAPLASSTVPSIRDILAADAAAEKEDARRARKEKKKKGKGAGEMTEEAKVNRDLQRLQAHEAKKGK